MSSPKLVVFFLYNATTGAPQAGVTGIMYDTYTTDQGTNVAQPAITEIGGGAYGFLPVFADPDRAIVYCVNPGSTALLPGRIGGMIRPEDFGTDTVLQFTGGGDLVNPYVIRVIAPTRNQVLVTFSKPVRMDTSGFGALNPANYRIAGLSVFGVLQKSDTQVQVTTSTQVPGLNYDLKVEDVTDLSGNPIITP